MKETVIILSHVTFDNSPYCIFVHEHAKALVKQGYRVIVFAIINWLPIFSHFQKYKKSFMTRIKKQEKVVVIDGVEVIYVKALSFSNLLYNSPINLNGYSYYSSIKRLFKKINKENNIVLVDAHTFKVEGYVVYKIKKIYPNLTTTVTLHGTSFFRNARTKNGVKAIQKVFNTVDKAICVSNKIEKIANECGVENTKVIYNGINQHNVEKVNKQQYKNQIITVGSLITQKKIDIIIKAMANLVKQYPNLQLKIVGVGPERKKLGNLVKEFRLEKNVDFKNQLKNEQVLELMNKSYIFVLPSINEGFGIVYAEAMRNGCITIGTKNEAIDGFIINGKNGFLVEPKEDEIEKIIDRIYKNEFNTEEIVKNAYDITVKLTWKNNAKKYIELLGENNERKRNSNK